MHRNIKLTIIPKKSKKEDNSKNNLPKIKSFTKPHKKDKRGRNCCWGGLFC